MVDCLRGDNRFNKGNPAGHSNKFHVASGKLSDAFIFEMLEVSSP
jgi:hypothetical protein